MLGQSGCRLLTGVTIKGYDAVIIENSVLRIILLPGKGTDVVEFVYKPMDFDFTWGTAWGLRSKGIADGFLDNYEGGWQEVFPNGGTASNYKGALLQQHDEVAMLPWKWRIEENSEQRVAISFAVDLIKTPFQMVKIISLDANEATFTVRETVTNTSTYEQQAMWGQHLAFGPPFLEPCCRIETKATTVRVMDEPSLRRRFKPGIYQWPWVQNSDGSLSDLRCLPPTGSGRDIVYLSDFITGEYRIDNPNVGLGLTVKWDPHQFPDCWFWQEFGDDGYPWYGRHYNIGLEPFCGYPTHGLAEAIQNGSARSIAGGQVLSTEWSVSVHIL